MFFLSSTMCWMFLTTLDLVAHAPHWLCCSRPKSTLPHASTTVTSTRTAEFVSTFSRTSGVQHWRLVRFCWVFARSWRTPIRMTRWFRTLRSCSRRIEPGTIVQHENGRPSMPCSRSLCELHWLHSIKTDSAATGPELWNMRAWNMESNRQYHND